MHIWSKMLVTAIAGATTYVLTDITEQPEIWKITMSVFVAGVVLVVQVLVRSTEESRRTAAMVAEINEATRLLTDAREVLGKESLTKLIKAAKGVDHRDDLQLRFADHLVESLTALFEGLHAGRAEYEGEDRDWLLGLTATASVSIDATSMTSFDTSRGYVDEGQFWASDLGQRYLNSQRRAIDRGVRIRRLFLIDAKEWDDVKIAELIEPHERIKVDIRTLPSDRVPFLFRSDLTDFVLFDQTLCYEPHSASTLDPEDRPLIDNVALVANAKRVQERRARFEEMWASAVPR